MLKDVFYHSPVPPVTLNNTSKTMIFTQEGEDGSVSTFSGDVNVYVPVNYQSDDFVEKVGVIKQLDESGLENDHTSNVKPNAGMIVGVVIACIVIVVVILALIWFMRKRSNETVVDVNDFHETDIDSEMDTADIANAYATETARLDSLWTTNDVNQDWGEKDVEVNGGAEEDGEYYYE